MILDKELYLEHGYLRGIFISCKNSFFRVASSLFKIKSTTNRFKVMEQKVPFRGVPRLIENSDKTLKCTSCGLCEEVCPTQCITIDKKSKELGKSPIKFELNLLKCIFCGLCSEVCPEEALAHDGQKDLCGHAENNWNLSKEKLVLTKSFESINE